MTSEYLLESKRMFQLVACPVTLLLIHIFNTRILLHEFISNSIAMEIVTSLFTATAVRHDFKHVQKQWLNTHHPIHQGLLLGPSCVPERVGEKQ
jgi:hypothetical protein